METCGSCGADVKKLCLGCDYCNDCCTCDNEGSEEGLEEKGSGDYLDEDY